MESETYLPQPGNFTGDRITDINTLFPVEVDAEVDLKVQGLLVKAGIHEEMISQYAKDVEAFNSLERIPEGDEQLLTRIKAMDRELTNRRNLVTKICEAGRKPHNTYRNAWIKAEKQYTREFEQIEAPLKKLLAAHKAEQERKEQEEKNRQAEMRHSRYVKMEAVGFTRRYRVDGTQVYFLGEAEFEVDSIDAADHDTFSNIFASARIVAEEIARRKAEEERRAKEERERIAAEQEALRKQQEEMARKEAEMKAREEAMQRQVNEVRKGELMALGCEEWVSGGRVCIGIDPHAIDGFAVWADELHAIDDARWANYILEAKAVVEERNLAIKAEQERIDAEAKREALIKERVEKLKSAGWEQSSLSNHVSLEENGHIAISLKEHDLFAFNEDVIAGYVNRGHAELARRKAAQEPPKEEGQKWDVPWDEPSASDLDKLRQLLQEVELLGVSAKKSQEGMIDVGAIRAVDVTREFLRSSHKAITTAIANLEAHGN